MRFRLLLNESDLYFVILQIISDCVVEIMNSTWWEDQKVQTCLSVVHSRSSQRHGYLKAGQTLVRSTRTLRT